jgi:RNA-directed DNA polymerase
VASQPGEVRDKIASSSYPLWALMKGFYELVNQVPDSIIGCYDVRLLAKFLGTDYEKLSSFLYDEKHHKYRRFAVKKKSGGERIIYAPAKRLKILQCLIKADLEKHYPPKACAHAFIKKKSIKTNARDHTNKAFVLNIDLKDFFPSISFGRVKRLFESQPFNLSHPVAAVLAHICCHNGHLPQGAPTSPIISNMIAYKLDNQLTRLASDNYCSYSRYADDITFSFTHYAGKLPKNIVRIDGDNKVNPGSCLSEIIKNNGFEINSEKTRLQSNKQRQVVTGLVVNKKVNVKREFIRQTSSMIHSLATYGAKESEREHFEKYFSGYIPQRQRIRMQNYPGDLFVKKIKGRINYIRMIRGVPDGVYRKLMYEFTCALGNPNENYNKSWWDYAAESVFVIDTHVPGIESVGQGTCFLLKDIGIITNQHVIEGVNSDNVVDAVTIFQSNHRDKPLLVGSSKSSKELDLGVIDPLLPKQYKQLEYHNSPIFKNGDKVIVIGFPNHKHGEKHALIESKIKNEFTLHGQKRISIENNLQHGTSGAPVFNADGLVIGIVSTGNKIGSTTQHDGAFIPIQTLLDYAK